MFLQRHYPSNEKPIPREPWGDGNHREKTGYSQIEIMYHRLKRDNLNNYRIDWRAWDVNWPEFTDAEIWEFISGERYHIWEKAKEVVRYHDWD